MFKIVFIRIAINMIKKTFLITTITSITRVISIIETIFILIIKSRQEITFKEFIYYNYNKIDYYKKDYLI